MTATLAILVGAEAVLARPASQLGEHGLIGHAFFGAGALLIGTLLLAEVLAGNVWRRSWFLVMLWPASLTAASVAMIIITYLQGTDKAEHLALALLLALGALFEMRYRLGHSSKTTADAIAIPALVLGALIVGPMHANGAIASSVTAQAHLLIGLLALLLAGIRVTQVRLGASAALDAGFGGGVMLLGLSMLMMVQLHGGH